MTSRLLTWGMLLLAVLALVMTSSVTLVSAEETAAATETTTPETTDDDIEITDDEDAEPDNEEDEEVFEEEEFAEFVLEASPDITTNFIFPDYQDGKLEIGEETTLLAVLANTGDSSFNLTEMGAFLHSNYDLTYYIQNYSTTQPATVLEPGEEMTLEFKFVPHPRLEPEFFHFSAYVNYNDTADFSMYRSTFFNQTIEMVDKPQPFDVYGALSYLAAIAAVGAGVYFYMGGNKKSTSSKKTTSSKDDDDWGEAYAPTAASRRKSSRKKRSAQE